MRRGKKYIAIAQKIDRKKKYSLAEAIKIIKENSFAGFDETVEIHIKTNVNSKKGDQQIRSTVNLPFGTGKTKKILDCRLK